jgi:outer membrane protein OmpA-like peptidoglycan-associated protein
MKLLKQASALTLCTMIASAPALADKRENNQAVKGGLTFTAATILGAIAGGPVGAFIGASGGAYLGEEGKKKVKNEIAMEKQAMALVAMEEELSIQELEIAKLEKLMEEKMQLQLHFKTGDDQLSEIDAENVRALSDFMLDNDYMHVNIDGHADPRGTDEYNNVLSIERANSVADILLENGIEEERITVKGHGSRFSTATPGNLDEYAEERKVKIEVHSSKDNASFATIE